MEMSGQATHGETNRCRVCCLGSSHSGCDALVDRGERDAEWRDEDSAEDSARWPPALASRPADVSDRCMCSPCAGRSVDLNAPF